MYANIQKKRRTLTFLNQICPRIDWGFEIQKTNAGIRINIVGIPCVAIFRQNWQLWLLRPKFLQKLIFGSEFQKSMCRFKISTSKKPCVSILSENGQFEIFDPSLITCNFLVLISLRVLAEVRLKWAGWRWGAWFSNAHFFNLRKKIIFRSRDI